MGARLALGSRGDGRGKWKRHKERGGREKVGAGENNALVVQQRQKDTTLAIWISLEL